MKSRIYIPSSRRAAGTEIRKVLGRPLESMKRASFVRAWCSLAYLYPGLHPDGYESPDSGWPRVLRRFAAEAWRRAEKGLLSDEELYPTDAAWSAICDQFTEKTPAEKRRRTRLANLYGDLMHA